MFDVCPLCVKAAFEKFYRKPTKFIGNIFLCHFAITIPPLPMSLRYGDLGFTIVHELALRIDNFGIRYLLGMKREENWVLRSLNLFGVAMWWLV